MPIYAISVTTNDAGGHVPKVRVEAPDELSAAAVGAQFLAGRRGVSLDYANAVDIQTPTGEHVVVLKQDLLDWMRQNPEPEGVVQLTL